MTIHKRARLTSIQGNPKTQAFAKLCQENKIEQKFTKIKNPQWQGRKGYQDLTEYVVLQDRVQESGSPQTRTNPVYQLLQYRQTAQRH